MRTSEIETVLKALEGKDICIRFRMKGREWHSNYSKVLDVFKDLSYVVDCVNENCSCIRHNDVTAFELDRPVLNYEAGRLYDVVG